MSGRRKAKPDYTELIAAANELNEAAYQQRVLKTDVRGKIAAYQLVRAAQWKLCEVATKLERIPK